MIEIQRKELKIEKIYQKGQIRQISGQDFNLILI